MHTFNLLLDDRQSESCLQAFRHLLPFPTLLLSLFGQISVKAEKFDLPSQSVIVCHVNYDYPSKESACKS